MYISQYMQHVSNLYEAIHIQFIWGNAYCNVYSICMRQCISQSICMWQHMLQYIFNLYEAMHIAMYIQFVWVNIYHIQFAWGKIYRNIHSICMRQYLKYDVHDTGWRRTIGCLKLQVIFRKRTTNYRALLRKMTHKDKASYESSPPCTSYTPDEESITKIFSQKSTLQRVFIVDWVARRLFRIFKGLCFILSS